MSKDVNKRILNNSLESLISKYKQSDVVSKIEKSIAQNSNLEIELSSIYLSPLINKGYINFDDLYIEEIEIKTYGILEPLLIYKEKKNSEKFLLLNGTKRYFALKKLGYSKTKAIIIDNFNQSQIDEFILMNIIRNNDNPLIIGHALVKFSEKYHFSNNNLSLLTGISYSQILNYIRLLDLSNECKKALVNHDLTYTKARPLLSLKNEQQIKLLNEIKEKNLSVRDIEFKVNRLLKNTKDNMKLILDSNKISIICQNPTQANRVYKKIKKLYKLD